MECVLDGSHNHFTGSAEAPNAYVSGSFWPQMAECWKQLLSGIFYFGQIAGLAWGERVG